MDHLRQAAGRGRADCGRSGVGRGPVPCATATGPAGGGGGGGGGGCSWLHATAGTTPSAFNRRLGAFNHPPHRDVDLGTFALVTRQCSRPGCAEAGASTLTYQYARSVAWLDELSRERDPHGYDLCDRHAGRLRVPARLAARRPPRARLCNCSPAESAQMPWRHLPVAGSMTVVRPVPGAAPILDRDRRADVVVGAGRRLALDVDRAGRRPGIWPTRAIGRPAGLGDRRHA